MTTSAKSSAHGVPRTPKIRFICFMSAHTSTQVTQQSMERRVQLSPGKRGDLIRSSAKIQPAAQTSTAKQTHTSKPSKGESTRMTFELVVTIRYHDFRCAIPPRHHILRDIKTIIISTTRQSKVADLDTIKLMSIISITSRY